jgi:YesN/AraC family two-component response regulator
MYLDTSHHYPVHAAFSIIYNHHSPCTITQLHSHNSYEILIPFCDDMKCFISNKVYDVRKGDVFIFPPGVSHKVEPLSNTLYERYVIYFKREYINSFSPLAEKLLCDIFAQPQCDIQRIHFEKEQADNLICLIKKAQNYTNSSRYAQEIYIQHAFFEILLLLSEQCYIQNSNHSINNNLNYFKIKDVLTYIYSSLSEDLSLDHLTAKFYISKTYLNKVFKLHTGVTVNQYIITIRIAAAKNLLQDGVLVSQVYEEVGFNNYSHFIRTFTKIVGVSPKQYAIRYEKLQQSLY